MAIASGPQELDALSLAAAELRALEHLGMAAASGTDLAGVQECIVTALNAGLGLDGATVGLVDEGQLGVGNWHGSPRETLALGSRRFLPIADGGAIEQAFAVPGRLVHTQLGKSPCAIAAACYRGEPLGLLAVALPPEGLGPPLAAALERFTVHAAEALAGVRMCVDRTRRLTVEAERTRISIDMHDAVIQSLFAIGCALDGCARATGPGQAEQARRLAECRQLVEKTLLQVRQSIYDLWPAELLERQFLSQLRQHLAELSQSPPALEWEARGQLADLPGQARHTLLAVAQEALTNVVRHAEARHVRVVLDLTSDPVQLRVSDDGVGLPRDDLKPQFGIRGMRTRLGRLGGRLRISSEPGLGTELYAELPRHPAEPASIPM